MTRTRNFAVRGKKPFAVPPLGRMTRSLALVASGRRPPDLLLRSARVLCPYTETILPNREVSILGGRIAAVKPQGTAPPRWGKREYDVRGGIVAPGLIDPHVHIESSMVGACAYAEAALRNGTTTIFCDSHEIANVLGRRGIEWMLEDARKSPLSIFLTVPSTVPATDDRMETSGATIGRGDVAHLFDRYPEAVALGEKMDFVAVASGHPRAHAILREALLRGRPVCGHIYGEEYVAAYAASGVTDTHEAGEGEIALQMLQSGMWIFLRGGPPLTPWHSLPKAIEAVVRLGASPKRLCVCTDDRDPDDLLLFGLDWVVREAGRHGLSPPVGWSLGSLHPALRFGMEGERGGLAPGRRADLVLLDDQGRVRNTWLGGELLVEEGEITPPARGSAHPTLPLSALGPPDGPLAQEGAPPAPVAGRAEALAPPRRRASGHSGPPSDEDRRGRRDPPAGRGRRPRAARRPRAPRQDGRGRLGPRRGTRAQRRRLGLDRRP